MRFDTQTGDSFLNREASAQFSRSTSLNIGMNKNFGNSYRGKVPESQRIDSNCSSGWFSSGSELHRCSQTKRTGPGANDHKILYNSESMSAILSNEGYDYKLLEYFDSSGDFHSQPWEIEDGPIERSAEHDPRNITTPITYTSLILDYLAARLI
jgi:hypothetical protein